MSPEILKSRAWDEDFWTSDFLMSVNGRRGVRKTGKDELGLEVRELSEDVNPAVDWLQPEPTGSSGARVVPHSCPPLMWGPALVPPNLFITDHNFPMRKLLFSWGQFSREEGSLIPTASTPSVWGCKYQLVNKTGWGANSVHACMNSVLTGFILTATPTVRTRRLSVK